MVFASKLWGPTWKPCNLKMDPLLRTFQEDEPLHGPYITIYFLCISDIFPIAYIYIYFLYISYIFPMYFLYISYICPTYFLYICYLFPYIILHRRDCFAGDSGRNGTRLPFSTTWLSPRPGFDLYKALQDSHPDRHWHPTLQAFPIS